MQTSHSFDQTPRQAFLWPNNAMCAIMYSTVHEGLSLILGKKNNRNCFFILDWCICCNVTLYKFFYNSEQSWIHFFFSNQTLIYGGLPCQNFFVFLYLFVCNVLPIFCYLHNEAILFLDTDRVWNKMLYLYLYPSLWYINPCIVFFVTVGK